MSGAQDFESSGAGSSPGWRHCVVFLGKTLNSHSASVHPGTWMVTASLVLFVTCDGRASHPGRGVASCRRNRDKLQLDVPLAARLTQNSPDTSSGLVKLLILTLNYFIPRRFFQIRWVTCPWLTTCLLPLTLSCGFRCITPTRGIRDLFRAIVQIMTWR